MTLQQLQDQVERHCNDLRRVLYFIEQLDFEPSKARIIEFVTKVQFSSPTARHQAIEDLRILLKRQTETEASVSDLRDEASQLGVRRYSRMDKSELISAVRKARDTYRANIGDSNGHPNNSAELWLEADSDSVSTKKT